MKTDRTGQDIVEKLEQAIEALQGDVQKVEIWAGALTAFTRPVPTYEANDDFLLPAAIPARTDEPAKG